MNSKPAVCALAMLLVATACDRRPGAPPEQPPGQPPQAAEAAGAVHEIDGIDWFDGELDAAFGAAEAERKLVFLYWGAEWCPPCHDLKAHVFSRPDFQDKLRQFVPVYLDGDAPGAQRHGAEFEVLGYPTVVVLDADRHEIARIAGGMDLASYADVLDLALENVQPLPALLAALRADEARGLSAAECRRLAYNGWGLDPRTDPQQLAATLQLAARRCPATAQAERDRLVVLAADFLASSEVDAVEQGGSGSARLKALVDEVALLLADRERGLAAGDALISLGGDFFTVARRLAPQRLPALGNDWNALMDAVESDPRYSATTQLSSANGRLRAARALAGDGQLPAAVAARARRTLDDFLARGHDGYARAGIINSASGILAELGDHARLKALLEEQVKVSKTPYYYYPDLGDIEEAAGNKAEALGWFERGYRESRGAATRFQWGTIYLNALLRISPEDEPRIRAVALDVLGELDGPDRIHARTRSRLQSLDAALARWAGDTGNRPTLGAIAQRWRQLCAGLPATDPVRGDCPRLVAAAS